MSMPYKVKLHKTKEAGVIVELDKLKELAMPAHFAVSVGNTQGKIDRLANYYNKMFMGAEEKNVSFRHLVSLIHNTAKEKGILTILSNNHSNVHLKGFLKFLSESQSNIDLISGYVAGNSQGSNIEEAQVKEGSDIEEDEDPLTQAFRIQGQRPAQFGKNDIDQLKALVAQASIKKENNEEQENTIVLEDTSENTQESTQTISLDDTDVSAQEIVLEEDKGDNQ